MPNLSQLYIIRPESTENLHTNPSIETNTTTHAANGGSIAASSTRALFGRLSLIWTPSSGTTASTYSGSFTLTGSVAYTFSVYGYFALGVPYRIFFSNTSNTLLGTATEFTGAGKWERKEVTYTPGTTTVRLHVGKNTSADTTSIYLDGFQLEAKSYATTFCDGTQKGCYWTAAQHGSTSRRYANYRAGGRRVSLTDYDAYMVDMSGTGAPPIEANILPYGYADGGVYQNSFVGNRQYTINVSITGDDLNTWHTNMEAIFDLIKPDLVDPPQPFVMGYVEGGNDIEIAGVYVGGMDLQSEQLRDISQAGFQVLCADPYWKEPTETVHTLTISNDQTLDAYVWRFLNDGTITDISPTLPNGAVRGGFEAPDGLIYFFGDFTTFNGVSANRICSYNPSTGAIAALGTGLNGIVYDVVYCNGYLYVCGDFTTAGGLTANARFARWLISSSTWSVPSGVTYEASSPTPSVRKLIADQDQNFIYVMGIFEQSTVTYGHMWYLDATNNTANWLRVEHSTPASAAVYDAVFDGTYITIVGCFTSCQDVAFGTSVTTNAIARYNVRNGQWSSVGGGGSATSTVIQQIEMLPNGNLVITINAGTTVGGISYRAMFNGSSWQALNEGGFFNYSRIIADQYGNIHSSGTGVVLYNLARQLTTFYESINSGHVIYNGTWQTGETCPATTGDASTQTILLISPKTGEKYLYVQSDQQYRIPGITTVTNTSKAKAYPKIRISGPTTLSATVLMIKNVTTGDTIYLNEPIRAGDNITIDLSSENKSVTSDFKLNTAGIVRPGSNLSSFCLLPGTNVIHVLARNLGGATGSVFIQFIVNDTHWTIHGGHS